MDRYVRVEQRKTEQPSIQENEVRIMAAGKMRNYISYATTLLTVRGSYLCRESAAGKPGLPLGGRKVYLHLKIQNR